MKKLLAPLIVMAMVAMSIAAMPQGTPVWYNGQQLHLLSTPGQVPAGSGLDTLYKFDDQPSVARVAPGAMNYHGGRWAVFTATWTGTPRVLTSAAAVDSAVSAGELAVTRAPQEDFRGPVQPGRGAARD